jgi:hypothetical protein
VVRIRPGVVLQCPEPSCGCMLEVLAPSAHGRSYRCACGEELVAQEDAGQGLHPQGDSDRNQR